MLNAMKNIFLFSLILLLIASCKTQTVSPVIDIRYYTLDVCTVTLEDYEHTNHMLNEYLFNKIGSTKIRCFIAPTPAGYVRILINETETALHANTYDEITKIIFTCLHGKS
jgi:hypothetical protein